jgi:hypothetical protein
MVLAVQQMLQFLSCIEQAGIPIGLDQRYKKIKRSQLASLVPKNFAYASFHAVALYRTS